MRRRRSPRFFPVSISLCLRRHLTAQLFGRAKECNAFTEDAPPKLSNEQRDQRFPRSSR